MKIDLAKVESQIKKLEELRRIASDPELLSLLETVMVNGSTPPAALPQPILPLVSTPAADSALLPPMRSALIAPSSARKGQLQAAVRDAVLRTDRPFTGYVLARKMENEGYKFASNRPGIAVIDALRALVKKGVVRVYRKGSGSEATIFERVTGGPDKHT